LKLAARTLLLLAFAFGACAESVSLDPPPRGEFFFPLGLAVHPAGYALVANSNFDVRYRHGSMQAVDLRALEQRVLAGQAAGEHLDLILARPAVALPNFSGPLAIDSDGEHALIALASRQTSQALLVDLDVTADGLKASCGVPIEDGDFLECRGAQNVIDLEEDDPFVLLLTSEQPSSAWEERSWTLWASFLGSGNLVGYKIPPGRPSAVELPVKQQTISSDADVVADAARSPASGYIYFTSRYNSTASNPLYFFHPGDGKTRSVDLYGQLLGNQTRGLAFLSDGYTLAVAVRDPDVLVFIDTRPSPSGQPSNTIVGLVDLDNRPARVFSAGDLVFVSDAEDDSISIVDARLRRLLQRREDICLGPFDFASWQGGQVEWLLVSCFEQNVIAVLDIDRNSPTFLQTVARVGRARQRE